eukprot:gb/GFBE01075760.1/.p1 GENE.gb/GFBE01075760.1/~~gb/GFBE01075760.1/.p1  ORF type:complete len:183 (+),score=24.51 gb/GFBE01075760.1/:1-549(+)
MLCFSGDFSRLQCGRAARASMFELSSWQADYSLCEYLKLGCSLPPNARGPDGNVRSAVLYCFRPSRHLAAATRIFAARVAERQLAERRLAEQPRNGERNQVQKMEQEDEVDYSLSQSESESDEIEYGEDEEGCKEDPYQARAHTAKREQQDSKTSFRALPPKFPVRRGADREPVSAVKRLRV